MLFLSSVIDGDPLRFRGEVYHPYHFSCTACGIELTASAREVRTRPGYTANELVSCTRIVFLSNSLQDSDCSKGLSKVA